MCFTITAHSETGIINLILQRENPRISKVKRVAQSWPILELRPPDLRSEPFTGHGGGSDWSTQVSVHQATVFITDVQMGTLIKGLLQEVWAGNGEQPRRWVHPPAAILGNSYYPQSWRRRGPLQWSPAHRAVQQVLTGGGRQEVPVTGAEVWKKQSNLPIPWSSSSSRSLPLAVKGSAWRRPSMCVAPWKRAG